MDKEYQKALREFREFSDEQYKGGDGEELEEYLLNENSFENPMDRTTAERLIKQWQEASLGISGGYPIRGEVSFIVEGVGYSVIAYGASGEGEGKDALGGMIFLSDRNV